MFSGSQSTDLPTFSSFSSSSSSSSSKEKKSKRDKQRASSSSGREESNKKKKIAIEDAPSANERIAELEENLRQIQFQAGTRLAMSEKDRQHLRAELLTLSGSHDISMQALMDQLKAKDRENKSLRNQIAEKNRLLESQNAALTLQKSTEQSLQSLLSKVLSTGQENITYLMNAIQASMQRVRNTEEYYQTQITYCYVLISSLQNDLAAANAKIQPMPIQTMSTSVLPSSSSSSSSAAAGLSSRYPQTLFQAGSPPAIPFIPLAGLVQPFPAMVQGLPKPRPRPQ
jgi:chromosome segregation ATPase